MSAVVTTERLKARQVTRAWWAVVALFLIHGLVVSSWISRIPAVQVSLKLGNGLLGLTLLSSALGAVSTIPLSGYLVTRFGSKPISILSSCCFCLVVILPGLATDAWSLAAALFVYGILAAAMDVSMNAQGVEVEHELGTSTMSRFHGMFSLGAMGGAFAGGLLAERDIGVLPHFTGSALLNLVGVLAVSPLLIPDRKIEGPETHRLSLKKLPKVLIALSAIGFLMLLTEGAMADWTAVYLRQMLHASQGLAALGYAVFSGAMAIFRFLGDLVTTWLGPMRAVRAGCLVAAAGLICALSTGSALWSLPGFALAGMGLSVIIPLIFGSGGRVRGVTPGAGIATVTGIGYIGFIVGPPTIGFASQVITLRYALGLIIICCFVAAGLAGFMRLLERDDLGSSDGSQSGSR